MTTSNGAAQPATPRPGHVRYLILLMLFVVTTVNYADRSTVSIAGDAIQHDFGISSATLGYVFSAFAWSYFLMQLPGGWLLDRFGDKLVYGLALLAWSVLTMLQGGVGLISSTATALVVLFVLRLLVGVAEAPSFPGNSRIVATWFPTKERGTAAAIFNSAQYFATAAFAPIMGWLVASLGWEHVFTVIGGLGVILAVVWTRVIHSPRRHPRLRQAELDHIAAGGAVVDIDRTSGGTGSPDVRTSLRYAGRLVRNRLLLGVFVGQFFITCLTWFFLTWFPVYLVQERGMSILEAGLVASLPALCGFFGGVLGGLFSDLLLRRGMSLTASRKIPIVTGMLLSTVMLACNYVGSDWLVVVFMALAFFGKGLGALGWAVMTDVSPKRIAGLAGGLFNAFGNFAGIVTPIVIGYIVDATGSFALALVFVGACAVMAVVSYLVIVRDIRRLDLADLVPGLDREPDAVS